ncbi:hypothetical protein BgramDRAFT_4968 [Paraburkholderia graminis C4D1M]|uniref:Uncharacterized protein n=1 Tax=Paraburkholderia graminis (strain ATCC 700544 / DSM 17151 / LMG 18924 / NCIMB 13744 / C4D1M) TaxID=396598 RepID=B1G6K7_PARG4|nr:hypothetical protein BgramDRAFT_4968 [Paraburkholderia graminis C4D1M]
MEYAFFAWPDFAFALFIFISMSLSVDRGDGESLCR